MKLTRRELVVGAASAGALTAQPQAQSNAPATGGNQPNADLAKLDIPISTEPAFQFKA